MNNSIISQHFFEQYPDDYKIRDAYESIFENPCPLYYELLKAFLKHGKNGSTFDSFIFQPEG